MSAPAPERTVAIRVSRAGAERLERIRALIEYETGAPVNRREAADVALRLVEALMTGELVDAPKARHVHLRHPDGGPPRWTTIYHPPPRWIEEERLAKTGRPPKRRPEEG